MLGQAFFGLLDSGANRTFINQETWDKLRCIGLRLDTSRQATCRVANDEECECLGIVSAPVRLKNVVKVIDFYVLPRLRHSLVLGIDFWSKMGIVPNIRSGEWHFAKDEPTTPQLNQIQSESDLTPEQKVRLNVVVDDYFRSIPSDVIGCTHCVKHSIVTHSPPIKQRYYPVSPYKQKLIDKELDEMIESGIVERSTSAWSSPVLLVPKKDGTQRFCVDFRKLNSVTEKDAYPLPYISSILSKLGSTRYISSLDIKSAYWQVELDAQSRLYTAFTVPGRGLYQFTRMPYGLSNAPATFQRLVDVVLGPELEPFVFCYLDDIIVVAPDFEKHLEILKEVLDRLSKAGLTLNREKSHFCRPELTYLGYVVNRNGLHVDPGKVQCILDLPTPKNPSDIRRVLGMLSWYRRFVPSYSELVAPLTRLLRKSVKFNWSPQCESAFRGVKEALVSAPILCTPDFSKEFVLQTDASNYGIGAVLTQHYDEREHVICYISRTLSRTEQKFSVTEKECLAVLWSIEKLRGYLDGASFTVITDHHSLLWLDRLKDPQGRLGRWVLRLQQYDYKIIHRKGKDHVVPDALSRLVSSDDSSPLAVNLIQVIDIRDPWYAKMVRLVTQKPLSYPLWRVADGKLYKRVKLDYPALRNDDDYWKLVVPKEYRNSVLLECHDIPTSGHLGTFKTFHRVAQLYYWPSMRADITSYVRSCQVCQRTKPEQKLPAGHMGKPIIPHHPWQILSIDMIGPLPRSNKGHQFIFVVTDVFSKFTLAYPLRRSTAPHICKVLEEQVFLLFGVPQVIKSDNGRQFKSREFTHLLGKYGVKSFFTPNYHPQANNVERVNRVLKTMITAYIKDDQRKWDEHLSALTCAIRTAKHEVTSQTPYFINFGREIYLSGQEHEPKNVELDTPQSSVERPERTAALSELCRKVREKLIINQDVNQSRYNLRRRDVHYKVGDWVWKRKHVLSDAVNYFSSKLAGKYEGPYKVSKRLGYCMYRLEDENGLDKGEWHVKDLKPFIRKNPE